MHILRSDLYMYASKFFMSSFVHSKPFHNINIMLNVLFHKNDVYTAINKYTVMYRYIGVCFFFTCIERKMYLHLYSASEMTYIVSGGALNSTHSLIFICTWWPKK